MRRPPCRACGAGRATAAPAWPALEGRWRWRHPGSGESRPHASASQGPAGRGLCRFPWERRRGAMSPHPPRPPGARPGLREAQGLGARRRGAEPSPRAPAWHGVGKVPAKHRPPRRKPKPHCNGHPCSRRRRGLPEGGPRGLEASWSQRGPLVRKVHKGGLVESEVGGPQVASWWEAPQSQGRF